MILVGNQRGGAKNLALHLLKEENERVEVHEIRGFCSDTLMGALNESYAMSRATKCKQHLFSLSFNPPKDANVSNADFEKAIAEVEARLGLTGQPRAIVFHEKENRRHCHAVWSRIKVDEMKAVQLSYYKKKLQTVARELYIEHGWKMPRGLANPEHSDPRNYTLAQWQQAKRAGKDAPAIKTDIQDAWAISDSKTAFTHALQERGYKLARGDRRGFVAVDYKGEVYSVSKWVDVKAKHVRERLGDMQALPSVTEAKAQIANEMLAKMQNFQHEVSAKKQEAAAKSEVEKQRLQAEQQAKRETQAHALALRQREEERIRQERIRKGLAGLVDRITGKRKKTLQQNEQEKQRTLVRDKQNKETLAVQQLSQRKRFIEERKHRMQALTTQKQELQEDAENFKRLKEPSEETRIKAFKGKLRSRETRQRTHDISIE